MRAHPRGAVADRALDHLLAARMDVLDGEIAFHRGDGADGFADAVMIMRTATEQACLVEMDVGIHESRQHQPAGSIDLGCLANELWRDGGDLAAGYADVDRLGWGPRPGVAEYEIEGSSRKHGGNLAEAAEEGSSRLCAIQRQNCSKYVHAI